MTTSIELSKQLYEVGLKIETEKWWVKEPMQKYNCVFIGNIYHKSPFDKYIPAPSADELLSVMPTKISICVFYAKTEYRAVDNDIHRNIPTQVASNPTEALAIMCFWMLTNGYRYNPETKMIEDQAATILTEWGKE